MLLKILSKTSHFLRVGGGKPGICEMHNKGQRPNVKTPGLACINHQHEARSATAGAEEGVLHVLRPGPLHPQNGRWCPGQIIKLLPVLCSPDGLETP